MTTTATTPTTTTSTGLAINTNPSSLSLQPLSVSSLFLSWESCLIPTLSLPLYLSLSFFLLLFLLRFTYGKVIFLFLDSMLALLIVASSSFSPLYSLSYFLFVDLCLPFLSYSLRVSLSFFSSHSVSLPIRSPTTSLFRCPYHRMFHTHTSLLHNMYLK